MNNSRSSFNIIYDIDLGWLEIIYRTNRYLKGFIPSADTSQEYLL